MRILRQVDSTNACRFTLTLLTVLMLIILLASCGGGSSSQPLAQNNATVQVNVGDAPSDRLVAFAMTINSMTFTNSGGASVSVMSSAATMELTHLMGTMQPVSLMKIPQGTYTDATINLSSMGIVYMNPSTGQMVQQTITGPITAKVNFPSTMTLGSGPMVANFDLDMANSVAIDNMGNMTFTPMFHVSMQQGGSSGNIPYNGGMQHMMGAVASAAASSFSFSMMESTGPMTIATNSSTQFSGMSGMGMMSNNQLLAVDAVMQPDGTMMATEIEDMMTSGGAMAMGLVTSLTGNPVSKLNLVAHDVSGGGMMSSNLAGVMTVSIGTGTSFSIDSDNVDMSNLPFAPTFDSTMISKGQFVDADSNSGMMSGGMGGGMMGGGTLTATDLRLEEQGFSGTVSGYVANGSQATFTLTLPSGSAFTTLTGTNSITVFQQAGTQLMSLTSVGNGNSVHVRGLLFLDAGAYKLVANRIMP